MPLFTYRATNDDNKEVRGSIDSPDEVNARKTLEDMNLDVITMTEASRSHIAPAVTAAPPEQKSVFAFEGRDNSGAVRRGTMQAQNKYEAFKQLRNDQKLLLTMLSPVGILPQYKDPELDQWQRGVKTSAPAPIPTATAPKPASRPTIGFTNISDMTKTSVPTPVTQAASGGYHPLLATLRLYAGWLLAWYGLFIAVGYYSVFRVLPWDIPFVQAFALSPLIFSFIVAIFIFMMLSAIHKIMKCGLLTGIALTIAGIGLFVGVKTLV